MVDIPMNQQYLWAKTCDLTKIRPSLLFSGLNYHSLSLHERALVLINDRFLFLFSFQYLPP